MRTLIVFAKEPIPGRVKTRLAAAIGAGAACRLYRAFLSDLAHTLAAARDLRVEWWVEGDPRPFAEFIGHSVAGETGSAADFFRQRGGDLGGRMREAFADAFAREGWPVALIGSDCPLIGLSHLESLFSTVEAGTYAALLPVEDGGYVGLALAGPAPEAFREIPWSTNTVLEDTLRGLRGARRRVQVLPPLYDVDTVADLARLASDLQGAAEMAPETARILGRLDQQVRSSCEIPRDKLAQNPHEKHQ